MEKTMRNVLTAAVVGLAAAGILGVEGEGMVFLQSQPPGARVFLDDEAAPRGETPKVLVSVKAGAHRARFVLDGHNEEVKGFDVPKDAAVTIRAELRAKPAMLRIHVVPDKAKLYVDGAPVEAGRATQLAPGDHTVRAEYGGHEPWERTVTVRPGRTVPVDIRLREIREEPAGAPEPEHKVAEKPQEETPAAEDTADEGEEAEGVPRFIDVSCWVCEGTGHIQTMGCPDCGAKGFQGFFPCQTCTRTGRVPAVCSLCRGAGVVSKGGKQIECPRCKGEGKPVCPYCKGTGKVPQRNPASYKGKTKPCPQCDATGRIIRIKCSFCGGTGQERTVGGGRGRWGRGLQIPCFYCKGEGVAPPPCLKCQGTGLVGPNNNRVMCPMCYGTGQRVIACPVCKGRSWIPAR